MQDTLSRCVALYNLWDLNVIPIKPNDKKPAIDSWAPFQKRKASKEELINWFDDNSHNIAIVCGGISGNLVVLDFEEEHKNLYDDLAWLWSDLYGKPMHEMTPIVLTGGGGYHVYLKSKERPPLYHPIGEERNHLPDIQSEGGYVIAPPSIHPNGKPYRFINSVKAIHEVSSIKELGIVIPDKKVTTATQGEPIPDHSRNTTLTRIGGALRRQGISEANIAFLLLKENAERCQPPLPEDEVEGIAKSVSRYDPIVCEPDITDKSDISDKETPKLTSLTLSDITDIEAAGKLIWGNVHEWLALHQGENFDLDTVCRQLEIRGADNRHHVVKKLAYEVERGRLEKSDPRARARMYRYINKEVRYIDWLNTNVSKTINVKWPYSISDNTRFSFDGHVCISPGDLIVLAGVSNMGKTAFVLNFLWANMDEYSCRLMGNEYTPAKFKRRVANMTWANPVNADGVAKFELIERRDNWKDIIEPDKINIIDWLNLPGNELYSIGNILDGIQSKLDEGIALVVIQKDEASVLGRGRSFSEELSSLYFTIDKGRLTVRKAKEWYQYNPNGDVYGFELVRGGTEFKNIRKIKKCSNCHGSGNYKGQDCYPCRGTGYVDN